jgi:hypothetical protein
MGAVEIEFDQYQYYNYGTYTMEVETSPDGVSWDTVWDHTGPIGPETTTILTGENVGGSNFHIAFSVKTQTYSILYWYIDNIEINGFPLHEAEYEDEICISDIEVGEEIFLEFDDWTPEFLQYETTGQKVYKARVWTDLFDPEDNNHANDEFGEFITLDYFHDVGVQQVSSPAEMANELIWDNGDTDGSNGYSILGNPRRSLLDDFELEGTVKINELHCLMVAGPPQDFEVTFWTDDDGDPGEEIETSEDISFEYEYTGRYWFGYPEYEVIYKFEDIKISKGIYWCEMWSSSGSPNAFIMIRLDMWGSQCWINYADYGFMPGSNLFGVQADLSYQLWGAGGAEVYVPIGNSDIIAVAENIGTFPERDMSCYAEIYEFFTNCSSGTLVYEDNLTGIDILEPLGGTATLTFEDYFFGTEGLYQLTLDLVDDDDDYPDNNRMEWMIGCDGTAPTSEHALDPPAPDGLNDYYVSDVEVTLTASDPGIGCDIDGSQVKEIKYQIDDGPVETIPGDQGTFVIDTDSNLHTVKYWSIDNVGNTEDQNQFQLKMDQTPPVVTMTYEVTGGNPLQGWDMLFTAEATDATSGMEYLEFALNGVVQETITGSGPIYEWGFKYWGGLKITIRATAYDLAGLNSYAEVDPVVKTLIKSNQQNSETQGASNNVKLPLSI